MIRSTNIAPGAVTFNALAPRPVGTNVGIGGLAISLGSGNYSSTAANVDVPNLTVTIASTGTPVFVGLISDGTNSLYSKIGTATHNQEPTVSLGFTRDNILISSFAIFGFVGAGGGVDLFVPPGSASYVDMPIASTHTYTFRVLDVSSGDFDVEISYVRLIAYEF